MSRTLVLVLAVLCLAACERALVSPTVDAGVVAPRLVLEPPMPIDAPPPRALDPADAYRNFVFVRWRSADELVRISGLERVTVKAGVSVARSALAGNDLTPVARLCAWPELVAALGAPPADATETIEIACGRFSGVIGCRGECSPLFVEARGFIQTAMRAPDVATRGKLWVRMSDWGTGPSRTSAPPILTIGKTNARIDKDGIARVDPHEDGVTICVTNACVLAMGAGVVDVDVIPGPVRWRCSSCTATPPPSDRFGSKVTLASGVLRTSDGKAYVGEVQSLVNPHLGEMQDCYDEALVKTPGVSGQLIYEWTLDHFGRLTAIKVEKSTLAQPETETCITAKMRKWRFVPPRGLVTTVQIQLLFHTL